MEVLLPIGLTVFVVWILISGEVSRYRSERRVDDIFLVELSKREADGTLNDYGRRHLAEIRHRRMP